MAGRLTELVNPFGSVSKAFNWAPGGFDDLEKVQLHKPNGLISAEVSRDLTGCWFDTPGGSGLYWDIASQCVVGTGSRARSGILLVEAKAHTGELKREGKKLKSTARAASRRNHERIGQAKEEANVGLRRLTGDQGWAMSRDECVKAHSKDKVPEKNAWDRDWRMANGASFALRIVSARQSFSLSECRRNGATIRRVRKVFGPLLHDDAAARGRHTER